MFTNLSTPSSSFAPSINLSLAPERKAVKIYNEDNVYIAPLMKAV